jgi:hypothetical protein
MARASSGSRSCSSSVEPLISANSAVKVLRSPSSAADEPRSGATRTPPGLDPDHEAAAASAPFVSGVPHLPPKSEAGGFSVLHFAHGFASAFPHFEQKLFVDGLFVPHFEQRIEITRIRYCPFSYHRVGTRTSPSFVETYFFQQRDEARVRTKWIVNVIHFEPKQHR